MIYVLKVAKEGTGDETTPIAIAIFPMITFLTSVATSSIIGKLYLKMGRKKTFTLGAVIQVIVSGSLMVLYNFTLQMFIF